MSRPPDVPQLVTEVAFASDPLASSYTWTDISTYVRSVNGVQVRRGKQTEVETTASSSLSMTLDNRDRRFDPTYASGPYYGNLKPRKAIRIRALWGGTHYPVFQGFVDGWPQDYYFRRDASVRLTAYDALAIAGQVEIQSAAYDYLRTTIGSLRFYLFNVNEDRWFDLQGNTPAVLAQGTMVTESIGDADGDGVSFNGSTALQFTNTATSASFSVSFWLSTSTKGTGTASTSWAVITDDRALIGGRIGIDSAGSLCYVNSAAAVKSVRNVAVGRPLFCTIVQNGTSPSIYVNGVDESDASTRTTGSVSGPSTARIGGPRENTTGVNLTGVVQSLAGVGVALTAAQVQTLYGYASRDLVEFTATRMGRLLDFMSWPNALRDLTTHPQVEVSEVPAGSQVVLAMMQTTADSEYGRLFVTRDGKVALQDRFWHLTSTRGSTTQATFSDDGSDLFYAGTGFDYSDREVANRVTVTGSFGRSATEEDSSSKTAYGLQTFTLSTVLSRQAEVTSAAEGILSRRKEPILRADAITVKPARQTSAWPTVLALELGDRIVIEVTPRNVSPQIQRTLLVERLDWSISVDRWEVAVTGSPVPAESFWVLGTSELDTETVLGW
jgi:hypothetical protein